MTKVLEVHDNDKEYVFTCPICGTVYTARERDLAKWAIVTLDNGEEICKYIITCPNCSTSSTYTSLEEYNKKEENGICR